MTQQEFNSMPHIEAFTNIMKSNPYGSIEHKRAFKLKTEALALIVGDKEALNIMGEY